MFPWDGVRLATLLAGSGARSETISSSLPTKYVPQSPLVSLVLSVKNAMPHVREAIEALQRQTYRNFEVVVQDGASTDGTVDYLRSVSGLTNIAIVSEPDSGIGQAYSRGVARVQGAFVCFISADEYLDDDALEKGVQWFSRHSDAAVVYGGVRLIDAAGQLLQVFIPPPFDWGKVIHNQMVVPMAATFLNRERIGSDLYYDESLRTCPDYDFWLRVGSKLDVEQFVLVPEPIVTAHADPTSMSFRAESFPQFTKDKLYILNRYLSSLGERTDVAALKATASAGILTWAAENVLWLEGVSPEFLKLCREAAQFDPHSARLSELGRTSKVFEISASGQFILKPPSQPPAPSGPMRPIDGVLNLEELHTEAYWTGAAVSKRGGGGTTATVTTASEPWSYSALIPLASGPELETDLWFWVKLNLQVLSGEIGISLWTPENIYNEQIISFEQGRGEVFIRLNQPGIMGVMVRNGSRQGSAVVEIFDATVVFAPRVLTWPGSE